MPFTTLIDTGELAELLSSPQVAIVDSRFTLDDLGWGKRGYQELHIPGAVFADVEDELSGYKTGLNGRHPLPDQSALGALLSRSGIDDTVQVVAYDQGAGMYASRLWWLLKWQGHDAVAVLNGGFAKWVREGRPAEAGTATRTPRSFRGFQSRAPSPQALDLVVHHAPLVADVFQKLDDLLVFGVRLVGVERCHRFELRIEHHIDRIRRLQHVGVDLTAQ